MQVPVVEVLPDMGPVEVGTDHHEHDIPINETAIGKEYNRRLEQWQHWMDLRKRVYDIVNGSKNESGAMNASTERNDSSAVTGENHHHDEHEDHEDDDEEGGANNSTNGGEDGTNSTNGTKTKKRNRGGEDDPSAPGYGEAGSANVTAKCGMLGSTDWGTIVGLVLSGCLVITTPACVYV